MNDTKNKKPFRMSHLWINLTLLTKSLDQVVKLSIERMRMLIEQELEKERRKKEGISDEPPAAPLKRQAQVDGLLDKMEELNGQIATLMESGKVDKELARKDTYGEAPKRNEDEEKLIRLKAMYKQHKDAFEVIMHSERRY